MLSSAIRERHTPALLIWNDAKAFLLAAQELASDGLPALFLACQGIELGLKSFLRAKGARITTLRGLGHSLVASLDECINRGLPPPPEAINRIIKFAGGAHESHEFRYGHLYHPRRIELSRLLEAGSWILANTADAVGKAQGLETPVARMRADADRVKARGSVKVRGDKEGTS